MCLGLISTNFIEPGKAFAEIAVLIKCVIGKKHLVSNPNYVMGIWSYLVALWGLIFRNIKVAQFSSTRLMRNYLRCHMFSSVLNITPTYSSSMQELIMQGMQQKMEKSCFRRQKNTWLVESNYVLQPPKYLIIVVTRFRYINNNFTKDRCSIPMDMTVGLHKFSLQVTIDHHGPSMYSGHYTTSLKCCKNTLLQRLQNYGVWIIQQHQQLWWSE